MDYKTDSIQYDEDSGHATIKCKEFNLCTGGLTIKGEMFWDDFEDAEMRQVDELKDAKE